MTSRVDRAQARELEILEDALARHAAAVRVGPGADLCVDCGDTIPAARREAVPGCIRCVECAMRQEFRMRRERP